MEAAQVKRSHKNPKPILAWALVDDAGLHGNLVFTRRVGGLTWRKDCRWARVEIRPLSAAQVRARRKRKA